MPIDSLGSEDINPKSYCTAKRTFARGQGKRAALFIQLLWRRSHLHRCLKITFERSGTSNENGIYRFLVGDIVNSNRAGRSRFCYWGEVEPRKRISVLLAFWRPSYIATFCILYASIVQKQYHSGEQGQMIGRVSHLQLRLCRDDHVIPNKKEVCIAWFDLQKLGQVIEVNKKQALGTLESPFIYSPWPLSLTRKSSIPLESLADASSLPPPFLLPGVSYLKFANPSSTKRHALPWRILTSCAKRAFQGGWQHDPRTLNASRGWHLLFQEITVHLMGSVLRGECGWSVGWPDTSSTTCRCCWRGLCSPPAPAWRSFLQEERKAVKRGNTFRCKATKCNFNLKAFKSPFSVRFRRYPSTNAVYFNPLRMGEPVSLFEIQCLAHLLAKRWNFDHISGITPLWERKIQFLLGKPKNPNLMKEM